MTNQPADSDAILGGSNPPTMAVLGGIQGVQRRLVAGDTSALADALRYGSKGESLIKRFFLQRDHGQFFIDMSRAGFSPRNSEKRFYWIGPCIDCKKTELLQVIRLTTVDLIWDELGKRDITVYPAAYSPACIQTGLAALTAGAEERASLETAIAFSLTMGNPAKMLAQNFLDRVWSFVAPHP